MKTAPRSTCLLALALLFGTAACLVGCGGPEDDPRAHAHVERLLNGDGEERIEATRALREIGRPGLSALRPLFQNADPQVRARAVYVWKHYAGPEDVTTAQTLLLDKNWVVRREAARLLARSAAGNAGAQAALVHVGSGATAEQHPSVLEPVAEGLGHASGAHAPQARNELAALVGHDVPQVRAAAVRAYGRIALDEPATRERLEACLASDPSPLVRMRAAESWWRITGEPAPALTQLQRGLVSGRPGVAQAALEGLRALGRDAHTVVPQLVRLLDDRTLRVHAAETLGALGPVAEAALPRRIEASEDPSSWFRQAAVKAVRSIRGS